MKRALQLFWATLREIFDEAAYERYLRRTGSPTSVASYANFLEASRQNRERKPRCC